MKVLRSLAAVCSLAVSSFLITVGAQAQVPGVFEANVGNYAPVALGSDVTLNACNSTFNVSGTTDSYSVCDIVEEATITYSWLIRNTTTGTLSFIVNAPGTLGSNFVLSTGDVGDFIQTAGTYELALNVVGSLSPFNIATTGGNLLGEYDFNDPFNPGNSSSTGFVVALTVTPAAVPEPEGLLLLLPAMLYAATRRKRKKTL